MEKICSIKLVTGEELVCTVIEIVESTSHTSVAIYNPLKISIRSSTRKTTNEVSYKFSNWLIVDKSDIDEINLNKIITICEVLDYKVLFEYNKFFQKQLKQKPEKDHKKELGFIGSVEEYKKSLEKLYRGDSYKKEL